MVCVHALKLMLLSVVVFAGASAQAEPAKVVVGQDHLYKGTKIISHTPPSPPALPNPGQTYTETTIWQVLGDETEQMVVLEYDPKTEKIVTTPWVFTYQNLVKAQVQLDQFWKYDKGSWISNGADKSKYSDYMSYSRTRSASVVPIPEPAVALLFCLGLAAILGARRFNAPLHAAS